MIQMTMDLIEKYQRPVIKQTDFFSIEAMIDTGAVFPVWMNDENKLLELGAVKKKDSVPLGGIGGMTCGTLYEIPTFRLGCLIYPNMGIIAHRSNFPVPILLPATMFSNLIYEVDDCNHKFHVTIPETESRIRKLTIEDKNGRLHVLCVSGED